MIGRTDIGGGRIPQTSAALLGGVRVVDLSRVLAGPYAAQILAELGADVIKIESPDGDPARTIGPHINGRSLYFAAVNTGKRSVVLDLRTAEGRAALDALLGTADIVVENFRPGAAAALGCRPADILARHPRMTVVTVSSYARDSAQAGRPTFDLLVQAESGIMAVTGEVGRPPARAGVPVGDLGAGLWGALAAVAGHGASQREGVGRHLEVPLLDAALSLLSYVGVAALTTGDEPWPVGSGHHSAVPYGAYPTADGWIAIAILGEKFWASLCAALDLPAGIAARSSNDQRLGARQEIDGAVSRALSKLTTADALARLVRADIPCAPVNTVIGALTAPYVATRGLVSAPAGDYRFIHGPLRPGAPLRPAPALGEHTSELLAQLERNSDRKAVDPGPGFSR